MPAFLPWLQTQVKEHVRNQDAQIPFLTLVEVSEELLAAGLDAIGFLGDLHAELGRL